MQVIVGVGVTEEVNLKKQRVDESEIRSMKTEQ